MGEDWKVELDRTIDLTERAISVAEDLRRTVIGLSVQGVAFYLSGMSMGLALGDFSLGAVLAAAIPGFILGCVATVIIQWSRIRSVSPDALDNWTRWWKAIGVPVGVIGTMTAIGATLISLW